MDRVVELWNLQYTNQVGGTACTHPKVEGFMVPIPRLDWGTLEEVFNDVWSGCVSDGQYEELQRLLDDAAYDFLKIVRGTTDSEAWIALEIMTNQDPIFKSLVGLKGFLTWTNSD